MAEDTGHYWWNCWYGREGGYRGEVRCDRGDFYFCDDDVHCKDCKWWRDENSKPTNYERYFGSTDKVARTYFGDLLGEMQDAYMVWKGMNPYESDVNTKEDAFRLFLESESY